MFRRISVSTTLLLLVACSWTAPVRAADDDGFDLIFDGKTLEGWDGDPRFWSVKDGAITGQTTKEVPTKGNTFIVWRASEVEDFELRLKFRIKGGNSGVQYRSKEFDKWRIGGYQSDFDAGGGWTGSLYEERGRGVLVKRGNKVVVDEQGKKKTVGSTTPEKDIVASVDKTGWNEMTIRAEGNHLVQSINGLISIDLVDNQAAKAAKKGLLALQLHAGPPMLVQFKDIRYKKIEKAAALPAIERTYFTALEAPKKKVVFIAGRPSHGFGAHEHYAGCKLLAKALNESDLNIEAVVTKGGWPEDKSIFDGAAAIVMYNDGGGRHFANKHLPEIDAMARKGVGVACIHYGVEVPKGESGDRFLNWIGGYFEAHWSVNPHWTAEFKEFGKHPVNNGVKPFAINDEWYFHMRFRPEMKNVTPILSATAPAATMSRGDGAHSGNPAVRKAVAAGKPQHVAWASENEGGSRGFGFTGGHFHWNWGNDDFRKLMLNAVVWVAQEDVPAKGVASKTPSADDLLENQDYKPRGNFDKAALQKKIDAWNK